VLNIINRLKDETAAEFDGVTAKYLKCIAVNIIQPLTYIFNLCIENSFFPEQFKLAIGKPKIQKWRPLKH